MMVDAVMREDATADMTMVGDTVGAMMKLDDLVAGTAMINRLTTKKKL